MAELLWGSKLVYALLAVMQSPIDFVLEDRHVVSFQPADGVISFQPADGAMRALSQIR